MPFSPFPPPGDTIRHRFCNTGKCPINGIWESWTPWTACTRTCGGGRTTRSRKCHGPFYNGEDCKGPSTEQDECSPEPCPVDGVWLQWSQFTPCSVTCGRGVISRVRECVAPRHGGKQCQGESEEREMCERSGCPIDGVWSEWRPWSMCLVTCGGGEQYRRRSCVGPFNGGSPCTGVDRETRRCGENPCPADGNWGEWGLWRKCDCVRGVERRYRECLGQMDGGKDCPGLHRDERSCECYEEDVVEA